MTMPYDSSMDETLQGGVATALQQSGVGQPMQSSANEQMEPNAPEDRNEDGVTLANALQKALYGDTFPPAQDIYPELVEAAAAQQDGAVQQLNALWAAWIRELWAARAEAANRHLHLIARNRMFRAGFQWVQSRQGSPWSNPARPKESLRLVHNMIDKALDQRLQILTDQRPGFTVTPMTGDPEDRRKASARQAACEYQYEQLAMDLKAREAAYWAQTDGCAFWHLFWDEERGPWDEMMGEAGEKKPLGDINCRTVRVEQVRVSPEATATVDPSWVVIRETMSVSEAAHRYGVTGVQAANTDAGHTQMSGDAIESVASWAMLQTSVGEADRLKNTEVVERFTVYVAPQSDALPDGLQLVLVGDVVVFGPSDLMWNAIPVVRITDGSSDPSYMPRPTVEQWLDHQTRMNVLLSKWQENIRTNAGGRFFGRPNSIGTETFVGGTTSFTEVRGGGPIGDTIQPIQGFSVGQDCKDAFALEKQAFEDASGYSAVSRGQVTGDSGRAIIAAREQLERVFAPSVQSMAQAYTDWAKVVLKGMAWGYDVPRKLGAVGRNRPDLARALSGNDLDGTLDVRVEKGTLMPMPLSYRMYLLDSWLQYGVIDAKEYRRRQTFAVSKDVTTPDEDQEARAKRIAEAIRMKQPVPLMRWQDNEAIHQDVLEREILLQDDLEPEIIAAADARWRALSQQQMQKSGMMQGPPMGGQGAPNALPLEPLGQLPPGQQPLASANPPTGAAPMVRMDMMGMSQAEQAGQQEDALTPQ